MPEVQVIRRNCGAQAEHRRLLNEDPSYVAARALIENRARSYEMGLRMTERVGITRIPVVVHVVWNAASENISDSQIQSQIGVLNQDFRKTNPDSSQVPGVWQPLASDSRIEFALATTDPNGNATTGITRTQSTKSSFPQAGNPIKFAANGGADAWPADRYLNIWVGPRLTSQNGDLLGYAQFPGGPAATDGVVILHSAFGTNGTAAAPFNLGRTATHEIGHWLNLFHIWGDDGTGCGGTDEVTDTPNQGGPNFGRPGFPHVSCGNSPSGDMFMNYMDYTDDAAMFMFTVGQTARMQATLDGPRVAIAPEMKLVVNNFGYDAGGWRVDRHPRFVTNLTGDRRADIIGFGNEGVWISRNTGNSTFQAPQLVVNNFGYNAGGWRVDQNPRLMADLTGDGRDDIVGFGNAGVWISLNNGNGTFQAPQLVVANFGANAGGWRVDRHPRFLADVTGDGKADIVGFGNAGAWVSRNNGNGTFQAPQLVVSNFGYDAGGWRVDQHPRFLADLTGDGRADIVGFGIDGVWVSLNNGNGTFQAPQLVVNNFGANAGGWRVDRHPRFLADVTGDGRADIVGFGNDGVWVSRNNGNGTFQAPQLVVNNFGFNAGGWRVDQHPRLLADLTGDGRADIVGFGNAGVWVSLNNGNGTFQAPKQILNNLGYNAGGWRVDRHPRFLADLTGDGRADIIGFGNAGVWVPSTDLSASL